MIMIIKNVGLRRNASSAKQSQRRKVWSNIKSNVLDNSIDEDKYQEGTGYRGAMKYLKGKLLPPH